VDTLRAAVDDGFALAGVSVAVLALLRATPPMNAAPYDVKHSPPPPPRPSSAAPPTAPCDVNRNRSFDWPE
jgi:hypothetical protein